MTPEAPALRLTGPVSRPSTTWLVITATMATGTNRANRVPASVRSLRSSGAGTMRHAAARIFSDTELMDSLGLTGGCG